MSDRGLRGPEEEAAAWLALHNESHRTNPRCPYCAAEPALCGCRADTELGMSAVCAACGHRDHGASGCRGPAEPRWPSGPDAERELAAALFRFGLEYRINAKLFIAALQEKRDPGE